MTGSWWIRLILVLCLSHGGNTADVDETCEFLSQAVDHVKIERSTDRNGRLKLNKLELKVFYKEIVSSFECLADIKLEMKVEGEEEWRKMDKWKRKKVRLLSLGFEEHCSLQIPRLQTARGREDLACEDSA